MSVVDVVILALVVGLAALGWRDGLVRALWAFVGTLVGTAAGLLLAPAVFSGTGLSLWVGMGAVAVVATFAVAGRLAGLWVERRVRARVTWSPRERVDRVGGVVFGVVTALAVSWALGLALAGSAFAAISSSANGSVGLRALDKAPWPLTSRVVARFERISDRRDYRRYTDVLRAENIVAVDAAPADVVDDPDIVAASRSVFQVYAQHDVMTAFQGTAFPIAPDRLMTAAHVVRDSDSIAVVNQQGERVPAEIVICDPDHDVAVLAAPGFDAKALTFGTAEAGDAAAVVGFPDDGPLTFSPARIRQRLEWQSADVYGNGRYTHDAYQVRGKIRGGNSGGPMFAEDGSVLGVVVAWSRADPDTGYVLTADQVSDARSVGISGSPGSADDCHGE